MAKQPRITVVQLDPGVPLGRFDRWLRDSGVRLSLVELWAKDVPQLASVGDGLLVLGGRMSVRDGKTHPWMDPLCDLLADAHSIDLPVLGICLGHQLLAETLGGHVTVADPVGGEEGPVEIEWLEDAADDPVFGALASRGTTILAESHHDTVTVLPAGAVELARSAGCANQAFRLGSARGVQFHPEATPELVASWSDTGLHARGEIAERMQAADATISASSRLVATGFVELVRAGS
ncbi:type 1 glutamine amidotransferase [Brooklawnia cerclae]|uniref:GMP synthase (Glutamine-hydrolysing) n=1 Tax=Brooklawnia cerclae TaxID=349934 RepID=A0ABX0SFM6_9ACTN|nr:type 1 glutamine amidotransferase [Brooklawnia cerclae]NIH56800.1 GMP synthase (glutamine-hydrolysing) [Brooklawnia cerclae]